MSPELIVITGVLGVLVLLLILSFVFIYRLVMNFQESNREYMRGILAKNLTDLSSSRVIEKGQEEEQQADLVSIDNLSNDEFFKIMENNKGSN